MLCSYVKKISSGRLNSVVWNLAGFILPLLVGVVFIPLLIKTMGVELFGVLSVIWMLVGYFTLFDLGISRALTFLLSRNVGAANEENNNDIYSTALPIVLLMGVIGGGIFWLCSQWFALVLFKINHDLVYQVQMAFKWTAVAIPFTVWATALRSCLESYSLFKLINLVKLPVGAWLLVGPYFFYYLSDDFAWAVFSLVVGRFMMFFCYWLKCRKIFCFSFSRFSRREIKKIFLFGGWMTVSNIISPVMVYFDRFFIGAYLSVVWVGFYAAPYEMITKFLVIPVAISSVFFPIISTQLAKKNWPDFFDVVIKFGIGIALAMGGLVLVSVVCGKWILSIWLGNAFSDNSYWVLFWISVGVFFNGLAQIPFSIIQAAGASKKTALIHVMEVPIYLAVLSLALWWGGGISVVAFVWFARTFVDFVLMGLVAHNMITHQQAIDNQM